MRTHLPGLPTPISDPTTTHGDNRRGGVGVGPEPGAIAELATVVEVSADTYTYRVLTMSGKPHTVPRKRAHPSDVSLLPHGTTVIVRYDLPYPYIDGVLDIPKVRGTAPGVNGDVGIGVTGTTGYGGQGLSASPAGGTVGEANFRAAGEPSDLLPGDAVLAHSSGSRVGALEGGVAVLVGSLLAQVRAHGLGDLLELISRNYRHVSDLGVLEVKNTAGKVGLSFRAATDQLTEAGNGEERWTVRLDIGAAADILDFRITTPTGENLFRVHIDGDGRCNVEGADGIVVRAGSSSPEPNRSETAGSVSERVGGDAEYRVDGARSSAVRQDATEVVGGTLDTRATVDALLSAGRDLALTAGRRGVLDAQGDASSSEPALELRTRDGDLSLAAGHAPRPQSKIRAKTLKGNIELESTQAGTISLKTLLGEIRAAAKTVVVDTQGADSTILGGNKIVGHVAIYEALERVLLYVASTHDAHVHPANGSPPAGSMQAGVRSLVSQAKSRRVGVGG